MRAFTLIELVVVVVILAIAAAVIAPRLMRDDARRAEASAIAVREVISAAATRAELTGRRVALTYDSTVRTLRVMEFRWSGSPTDWDAGGAWREDELIAPATLDDAEITAVRAEAFGADPRSWTIDFPPGARRPSLSVVVAKEKSQRAWRIDLPGGSMHADLTPSDIAGSAGATAQTGIDLDAIGKQEEPW